MYQLLGNISFAFFLVGLVAAIILAVVSAWRAHYRKKKLSQKRFTKFIYLIGATSLISGAGFVISTITDSLPQFSVFRTLLMSVLCIGFYPTIMIGVYIFDMKHYGYVETTAPLSDSER